MSLSPTNITTTRRLAAAIAAAVAFDVAWVRAPFLIILAVPFAVIAWRYRGRTIAASIAVFAFSALFVAIGVAFILTNGLHAPAEPHQARETINAGDFVFAYIGTPLAAWLGVRAVRSLLQRRRTSLAPATV